MDSFRRQPKNYLITSVTKKLVKKNCVNSQVANLSDKVLVEGESDVGGVAPVDDGDASAIGCHVQTIDYPLDEVQHEAPSLGVHCSSRVQHEHEVDLTAAACNASPSLNFTVGSCRFVFLKFRFWTNFVKHQLLLIGLNCGKRQTEKI